MDLIAPDDSATAADGAPAAPPRHWCDQRVTDVVDRYQRPLLAYATRMLHGDAMAAQDAVQETFLRMCREDHAKIASRLAAWLFSVCRTRVIDMQRTKQPRAVDAAEMAIPDPHPDAESIASDAEQADRLNRQIDQLSARQQEVLRLRMQAGLSYREIAAVTGLTVGNVGFHLHEAVRNLRQALTANA